MPPTPGRSKHGSNRAYPACSAAVRSWKAAVEARTWASSSCPAEADVAGPTTRPTLNVDQTKILKNHLRMYCPLSAVEVGIEDADLRDRVDGQRVLSRRLPDRLRARRVVDGAR